MTTTDQLREYLDAHGIDGHPTELRLYSDAETKLKRLCRGIERDGKPGAEYTALINEDEARREVKRLARKGDA